jgi:hypothetical protein
MSIIDETYCRKYADRRSIMVEGGTIMLTFVCFFVQYSCHCNSHFILLSLLSSCACLLLMVDAFCLKILQLLAAMSSVHSAALVNGMWLSPCACHVILRSSRQVQTNSNSEKTQVDGQA